MTDRSIRSELVAQWLNAFGFGMHGRGCAGSNPAGGAVMAAWYMTWGQLLLTSSERCGASFLGRLALFASTGI